MVCDLFWDFICSSWDRKSAMIAIVSWAPIGIKNYSQFHFNSNKIFLSIKIFVQTISLFLSFLTCLMFIITKLITLGTYTNLWILVSLQEHCGIPEFGSWDPWWPCPASSSHLHCHIGVVWRLFLALFSLSSGSLFVPAVPAYYSHWCTGKDGVG